jgi:hypothetical protein
MDLSIYILEKLDWLTQGQQSNGELLRRIEAQNRSILDRLATGTMNRDTPKPNSSPFSKTSFANSAGWILALAVVTYLIKGGDPMTILSIALSASGK